MSIIAGWNHYWDVESTSTGMKCIICQKFFPQEIFKAHNILHSEDKIHHCDLCGIAFTTKVGLVRHSNSH